MKRSNHGFSLMELMIVLVIAGILAAVAYPSYQNSVRQAKRSDGHAALTTIAAQQERFFSDDNTYTTNLANLGYPGATAASPEGHYVVTATAGPTGITSSFVLSAAAQGGQTADAGCTNITINQAGQKAPAACWD